MTMREKDHEYVEKLERYAVQSTIAICVLLCLLFVLVCIASARY